MDPMFRQVMEAAVEAWHVSDCAGGLPLHLADRPHQEVRSLKSQEKLFEDSQQQVHARLRISWLGQAGALVEKLADFLCQEWHQMPVQTSVATNNQLAIVANRFNYVFNLKGSDAEGRRTCWTGGSYACDTACSSSLVVRTPRTPAMSEQIRGSQSIE